MTDEKSNEATLYSKLAGAMANLGRLPKNGYNKHFKYDYVTDGDVADAVRNALSSENIAFFASMEEVSQEGDKTTVVFEFTFACGDTGAAITKKWVGEANDRQDKGMAKAATSALKYFLLKTLVLSTGDEVSDDPDSGGAGSARGGPKTSEPLGYWETVYSLNMTQAEGKAHLQQRGGDLDKAMKALAIGSEKPDPGKESGSNGATGRPMKPETVKAAITAKAKLYAGPDGLTEKDHRSTVIILGKLCLGSDENRHAITEFLTSDENGDLGVRSSKELTAAIAWSIRQWGGATRGNGWQPSPHSVAEVVTILAHLQGEEEEEQS
ncbi:MAG: ERF family protein [Dehalococcoidales bacterium]